MPRKIMIGLKRDTLKLVPHDPNWKILFSEERQRIKQAIGQMILRIEHVGSTAIPTISAKPIIDIAIEIPTYEHGYACVQPLTHLGYLYKGANGIEGRHYFRTNAELVKFHIHLFPHGHEKWRNHLLFRNYL